MHLCVLSLPSTFPMRFVNLLYMYQSGRMQAYLIQILHFQTMDMLYTQDYKLIHYYAFFQYTIQYSQQWKGLAMKWDIEALFLQHMKWWPFHDSFKPCDDSSVEIRNSLPYQVHQLQQPWWLSWVQNITIWPSQHWILHTISFIEFKYHSYRSIEHDYKSRQIFLTEPSWA
jgi:hypothetical protein